MSTDSRPMGNPPPANDCFAGPAFAGPTIEIVRAAPKARTNGFSRFEVYRTDRVSLTSTLFGGGDWQWRLTSASGATLVESEGYRDKAACLAAVASLRREAGTAIVSTQT